VKRLREPRFPGGRIAEPSSEQRVERTEIEHHLVDVEDHGAIHGGLRKEDPGA
jgi:hypothetical protein